MGGNALKKFGITPRRLSRMEYIEMVKEITDILTKNSVQHFVPPTYENKETFGDVDILVVWTIDPNTFIKENFKTENIVKSGYIKSFDFRGAQIDFISFGKEHFDFTCEY